MLKLECSHLRVWHFEEQKIFINIRFVLPKLPTHQRENPCSYTLIVKNPPEYFNPLGLTQEEGGRSKVLNATVKCKPRD